MSTSAIFIVVFLVIVMLGGHDEKQETERKALRKRIEELERKVALSPPDDL